MRQRADPRRTDAQRGLMLMECLVYLSVWFVLVSVGLGLFYQAYSQSKQLARKAQDIVQTLQTGERWRAEVRDSRTIPRWIPRAEGAGEDFVLGGEAAWIAYRATGSNILRRTEADPQWREVLRGVQSSTMHRDERGAVVSWRWELELRPHVQRARVCPRFTFQAVPRNGAERGGGEP